MAELLLCILPVQVLGRNSNFSVDLHTIMADYWKSQPRKFCDFCKCWIADNKPSRDFHEKGKKHQENVKRKLDELRKKGKADAEKAEEDKKAMQEMEEKAMAALKKDIMANPSLAAQYGIKLKPKEKDKDKDDVPPSKPEDSKPEQSKEEESDVNAPENWYEAQSPEGYTYYWNTVTQESRWVPPEGYISPAERLKSATDTSNTDTKETKSDDTDEKKEIDKTESSETAQRPESPTDTEAAADTSETKQESEEDPKEGSTGHSAYGQWETVSKQPQEPIDLQLPVSKSSTEEATAVVMVTEPKIKFREKKVTSLGAGLFNAGPTGFKKRKLNPGASLRKRDDS